MDFDIIRPPPPIIPGWFYLLLAVLCLAAAVHALRVIAGRPARPLPGLRLRRRKTADRFP